MTNEANIPKPIGNVLVVGGRNQGKTLHVTLELIEENTKLKAEIEQYKSALTTWNNANNEMLKFNQELKDKVEQLKERLEIKDNNFELYSNALEEIEQLKSELEQVTNLMPKICETCKYEDEIGWKEPCNSCNNGNNWKLKGQVKNEIQRL